MGNKAQSLLTALKGVRPYLLIGFAVVLSYIMLSPLAIDYGEYAVRTVLQFGLILSVLVLIGLVLFKRIKAEHIVPAIIAIGMLMRIGYMLYTPFMARGHDIDELDQAGHFAYMYEIFTFGSLPETNANQLYHPPFQHLLQVGVAKIAEVIMPDIGIDTLFESTKIVPCFASCAIMPVCYRICQATRLSRTASIIALLVIAFHPAFYILSASVNNDAVMQLLFLTALLYTIRWYYQPTIKNILMTALSIGFAMMTKLSGGMVALFTAPVFLAVFIKWLRQKKAAEIFGQFAAFLGVCVPLGLWYPLRNAVLFDQPLGYVPRIGQDSNLYIGGRTIAERFFSFPLEKVLDPVYCHPRGDYNIWLYTLKSSVFGEYTFEQSDFLAQLLIITNLILIILSLAAMVYVMVACREVNKFARFGLFFLWFILMASFILFNIEFPYGCTMDFRYILLTCVVGAVYMGIALDSLKKKGKAIHKGLFLSGCAAIGAFIVASALFYSV